MPPKDTVMLSAAGAQAAFIKLHPLTYKVTDKFFDDHITAAPNLSKATSIASAVKRYEKQPNVVVSSWILLDKDTLENKAKDATKVACLHNGAQQMAIAIKVKRRTVTISAFTRNAIQGDNPESYTEVTIPSGEKRYLDCKSEEKELFLSVKGPWKPLTGEVELYHYDERPISVASMVPKYLNWVVDPADRRPIRPVANT
jgi:hypothetical protein